MEHVSPTLGCGLLGVADDSFTSVCAKFQVCRIVVQPDSGRCISQTYSKQTMVLEFVQLMFSREDGRFRSREHLGECILEEVKAAMARAEALVA